MGCAVKAKRATRLGMAPQDDRVVAGESVEGENPFAVIDRMRAAFADVSDEEIERETAKAIAEVRAEMAAERAREAGLGG